MVAIVIWRKQTGKQAGIHSIVLFILLKSSIWKYHFICDFNYIKLNENLFHNITYAVPAKANAKASEHVIIRKHEDEKIPS